jgi:hypothetical protein
MQPESPSPFEHASFLVGYYQNLVAQDASNVEWQTGLEAAQKWHQLINQEVPSSEDVNSLLQMLANGTNFGSAWFDLKLGVNAWARHLMSKHIIPANSVRYLSRFF